METFGSLVDIKLTEAGDIDIVNGDIMKITGTDWFAGEVRKIVMTNNPDWMLHPNIGASLEDFIGRQNTRKVASEIENRIRSKVTEENLQYPGQLTVRVVPVSKDAISIMIMLDIGDTVESIGKVVFDFTNGHVTINENVIEIGNVTTSGRGITTRATNPYLSRIR